jgi:hypothetical protein
MGLDCVCMWGGLWTVHMCQTWNVKSGALVSTVLSMDGGWPSEFLQWGASIGEVWMLVSLLLWCGACIVMRVVCPWCCCLGRRVG